MSGEIKTLWEMSQEKLADAVEDYDTKNPDREDRGYPEPEIRAQWDYLTFGCVKKIFLPHTYFKYDMASTIGTDFFTKDTSDEPWKPKDFEVNIALPDEEFEDKTAAFHLNEALNAKGLKRARGPPPTAPMDALLTRLYVPYQSDNGEVGPRSGQGKLVCPSFRTHSGKSLRPIEQYDRTKGTNTLTIEILCNLPPPLHPFPDTWESGSFNEYQIPPENVKAVGKGSEPYRDEESEEMEEENMNEMEVEKEKSASSSAAASSNMAVDSDKNFTATSPFFVVPACKLIASWDNYLGTELFTGAALDSGVFGTMKSPDLLANTLPNAGFGLFIIAGEQRIIGRPERLADGTLISYDIPKPSNSSSSGDSKSSSSDQKKMLVSSSNPRFAALTLRPAPTIIRPDSSSINTLLADPGPDQKSTTPPTSSTSLSAREGFLSNVEQSPTLDTGFLLDNSKSLQSSITIQTRRPLVRIVNEPIDGNTPGGIIETDATTRHTGDSRNSPSIACVIMSNKGGTAQIHHYFAGDALWDVEQTLAEWINEGKTKYPNSVMKASQ
jgi:hypothetical protein